MNKMGGVSFKPCAGYIEWSLIAVFIVEYLSEINMNLK